MSRQPRKPYLADERFDQLGRMMFQLLSEVWVMRDRMVVTEELLRRNGVTSQEALYAFVPDAALDARRVNAPVSLRLYPRRSPRRSHRQGAAP